jgi:hypothetical protein
MPASLLLDRNLENWTCPAADYIPSAPVGQFGLIAEETFLLIVNLEAETMKGGSG